MLLTIALTLHLSGFLCDSPLNAIAYADAFAHEAEEETAANDVGKAARQQVCGFYAGDAALAGRDRVMRDGSLYEVSRYVFATDGREAFEARRVFDAGVTIGRDDSY